MTADKSEVLTVVLMDSELAGPLAVWKEKTWVAQKVLLKAGRSAVAMDVLWADCWVAHLVVLKAGMTAALMAEHSAALTDLKKVVSTAVLKVDPKAVPMVESMAVKLAARWVALRAASMAANWAAWKAGQRVVLMELMWAA